MSMIVSFLNALLLKKLRNVHVHKLKMEFMEQKYMKHIL